MVQQIMCRTCLHALFVVASGCGSLTGDRVCLALPRPAIQVDVRDSASNAPIAHRASLIVQNRTVYDSTYRDVSALGLDTLQFSVITSSSNGLPGTYDVRVRHANYRLWQQSGVRVGGDDCGADLVKLAVRLQPTL